MGAKESSVKDPSRNSNHASHQNQHGKGAQNQPPQAYYKFLFDGKETGWQVLKSKFDSLSNGRVQDIQDLNEFMRSYYPTEYKNPRSYGLIGLSQALKTAAAAQKKFFFQSLLPFIGTLAMKADTLFPKPIPILSRGITQKITLSKEQCASLLSLMFFALTVNNQNPNLPRRVNFQQWLFSDAKTENLKCLLEYFEQVNPQLKLPGNVDFIRLAYDASVHGNLSYESWKSQKNPVSGLTLKDSGRIEDTEGAAIVDFANKYLGGGVLGFGNVQEEILFTIYPECLVGILFAEGMRDDEAIMIKGVERYSNYSGYSQTFKFEGPYVSEKQEPKTIIAIDATDYSKGSETSQFKREHVSRELNKAFIGFFGTGKDSFPIATGRWGCGVFKGDPQLKFIIQWLAASRARRDIIFFTNNDKRLGNADRIVQRYGKSTIGEVMTMIELYELLVAKGTKYDLFTVMLE